MKKSKLTTIANLKKKITLSGLKISIESSWESDYKKKTFNNRYLKK